MGGVIEGEEATVGGVKMNVESLFKNHIPKASSMPRYPSSNIAARSTNGNDPVTGPGRTLGWQPSASAIACSLSVGIRTKAKGRDQRITIFEPG